VVVSWAAATDPRTHAHAGGGVVAASDPAAEYPESCNKPRALIRAAEEAVAFARSAQ
jgi:anthranilate synthase component 1